MIELKHDEIYYNGVLVARLVETSNYTARGDFIDAFEKNNELYDYEKLDCSYANLKDALVSSDSVQEALNALHNIKKTPANKIFIEEIEDCLEETIRDINYMYDSIEL